LKKAGVEAFCSGRFGSLAWFIDRPIATIRYPRPGTLLAGNRAVVPPHWRVEVANGFVGTERRSVLTPSDSAESLQTFQIVFALAVEEGQQLPPLPRVIATAREFRLTAYDAEYLDTARMLQLPLATLDRHLAEAAERARVPLFR
jgi:predicted nucleic acid-binding protein